MEIKFRDLKKDELEWARKLHNDPEVLSVLTDPHEVSPKEQLQWFKKLTLSKTSKRLVVILDNIKIGIIRLDKIDYYNKSIMVGLDIYKDYRGKGYGKLTYQALLDYCFNKLKMHRVYLMVADHNKRAHNLYMKVGFKKEGKMRDALFRNSKYIDYIMMSILEEEYVKYNRA